MKTVSTPVFQLKPGDIIVDIVGDYNTVISNCYLDNWPTLRPSGVWRTRHQVLLITPEGIIEKVWYKQMIVELAI